jgi:hypothetical protein
VDGGARSPEPFDTSGRCAACGAAAPLDRWFCSQCGEPLRPTQPPASVGDGDNVSAYLSTLITAHGTPRRLAFGRAMRLANGGRAVRYNEGLAFPTIAFRLIVALIVIAAIIVAIAVAEGAGLSTIGLGG